ncbi:MAG TPA: IS1595 family transposase [Micropepsaceae bacterium]|nr:IS1595 family transposase [Micropepsaceae bacterium]
MTADLTKPEFTNEAAAIAFMEADRWPNGVTCPLCGVDTVHKMGGLTQAGMFVCNGCHGKFTVRTGTVFERSHIPLHKWLLAMHLMSSSKKGISAHQLHRMLGITYKSAWFMAHRIREAMAPTATAPKIGGKNKVVEADETVLSRSRKTRIGHGYKKNIAVLSLVERGGRILSFPLAGEPSRDEILPALFGHVDPKSILHTDGAQYYKFNRATAEHESVDHNKQYVRKGKKGRKVHTNTAEGYFSIFKRGMVGTYQHCGEQHLHRYLAEFDFRASNRAAFGVNDEMRAERILKGAEGKRLTYRQTAH